MLFLLKREYISPELSFTGFHETSKYLQDLNNAGAPISPAFLPTNREHWLAINEMGVVSEQTYETDGVGFVCQFIGIPQYKNQDSLKRI